MSLATLCRKEIVFVRPQTTVKEAARLMEERNIGCVVITEDHKPAGILTDRDIVLRVVNKGLNPDTTPVCDVMTKEVIFLREHMGLLEALEEMKANGVRRLPVIDDNGDVNGIITLDDIIYLLGKEMIDVATIIGRERPETI